MTEGRLPNVLFITDNGHGLGHLTRMMAVARRADGRFSPVFLTMSQAYPIVRQFGWAVEYLPSYKQLAMSRAEWEPLFASRLVDLLKHIEPRVVVVDHISPSAALSTVRSQSNGIEFVWSRRGMWKEGRNLEAIQISSHFDFIVEPRDIAGPMDIGATTEHHEGVEFVAPVVLLDQDEHMERSHARYALGIPPEGTAVLINLSHSDKERLSSLIAQVRDVTKSSAGDGPVHLFSPLHVLHKGSIPRVDGVIMRPVYPVAAYLEAFDAIISTAGYNSFHEAVASGLPAVFVARDTDALDDQKRRAEFAELTGRGYFAPSVADESFITGVERVLAAGEKRIAAQVTREFGVFSGAAQFADFIAERCGVMAREPVSVRCVSEGKLPQPDLLERLRSGPTLPGSRGRQDERVVIVTLGFDMADLAQTVRRVGALQERHGGFKSVFLIDDVDPGPLEDFKFKYESIMPKSEFQRIGGGPYADYVRTCVEGLTSRYKSARVVTLTADQQVRIGLLRGDDG